MSYFDRKNRMMLYESKLAERALKNEEVLKTKQNSVAVKVGDKVSYKDNEYIVKMCENPKCVLGNESELIVADIKDVNIIKSALLDESTGDNCASDNAKFHVEAYNKDADIFTEFLATDDYDKALLKASELNKLCKLGKLIDTDGEPFDWVQITANDTAIWLPVDTKDTVPQTNESLKENISDTDNLETEIITADDVPPTVELGVDSATQSLIIDLLRDNLSLVDKVSSAILSLIDAKGDKDIIDGLTVISAQQNISIGKLYELIKLVNPQSKMVEIGEDSISSN